MHKKRPSIISGTWYPGSEDLLRKTILEYLDKADFTPVANEICGMISPHAGYQYSGQTAAYGYKQIQDKKYDVVVILSPMHHYPSGKYVVNQCDCYETPLGCVPVDHEFIHRLSIDIDISYVSFDQEHSLEIQLPFLQVVLESFKIVPIMIGYGDVDDCEDLADALYKLCKDKSCLIVASSDMHHTSDYKLTESKDNSVVNVLKSMNIKDIQNILNDSDCSVCGKIPIITMLICCIKKGANQFHVLNATNSSNVTGEKKKGNYTVGYLSATISS